MREKICGSRIFFAWEIPVFFCFPKLSRFQGLRCSDLFFFLKNLVADVDSHKNRCISPHFRHFSYILLFVKRSARKFSPINAYNSKRQRPMKSLVFLETKNGKYKKNIRNKYLYPELNLGCLARKPGALTGWATMIDDNYCWRL